MPRYTEGELFQQWYSGRNITGKNLADVEQANGWLPMTVVLSALGESQNNAKRYLDSDSDTTSNNKLWVLGPQKKEPVYEEDWTQIQRGRGGGYRRQGSYHVRQTFLKKIVVARYKHRLPK